jgi:hypothetical protein
MFGKRPNGHLDDIGADFKRVQPGGLPPKAHPPIQPGSTPWAGSRRYLCSYRLGPDSSEIANVTRPEPNWSCLDGGPGDTPYCHSGIL